MGELLSSRQSGPNKQPGTNLFGTARTNFTCLLVVREDELTVYLVDPQTFGVARATARTQLPPVPSPWRLQQTPPYRTIECPGSGAVEIGGVRYQPTSGTRPQAPGFGIGRHRGTCTVASSLTLSERVWLRSLEMWVGHISVNAM